MIRRLLLLAGLLLALCVAQWQGLRHGLAHAERGAALAATDQFPAPEDDHRCAAWDALCIGATPLPATLNVAAPFSACAPATASDRSSRRAEALGLPPARAPPAPG